MCSSRYTPQILLVVSPGYRFVKISRVMPTFTSIALDRLLEPGGTKSMATDPKSVPRPKGDKYKLNRRNSVTAMPTVEKPVSERKYHWAQITPALYTTPETTPLPDSPSSFPTSPYIINHKRRGPRLLKSHSVASVSPAEQGSDEVKVNGCMMDGISDSSRAHIDVFVSATQVISPYKKERRSGCIDGRADGTPFLEGTGLEHENSFNDRKADVNQVSKGMITMNGNGSHEGEHVANCETSNDMVVNGNLSKSLLLSPGRDGSEGFVDPQDSLSFSSNCEIEDEFGVESSVKLPTPGAEFFDAWEELSSEGGAVPPHRDFEDELREMRPRLLLEVEKRKQAEDVTNNMQLAWERIREELSQVGIVLPLYLTQATEDEHSSSYLMEDLSQQVHVARFVSQSIGRGLAKAEAQVELEGQLQAKNFEIARLCDRLNYYETVNREMSQRNQESVELARRLRRKRKTKRRWVWASITAAVAIGTVALTWAYTPASRGSAASSTSNSGTHGNNFA